MYGAVLSLLHLCGDWINSVCCDGLWLLRGYLQPSARHSRHIPETLCHASDHVICTGSSFLLDSHLFCCQIILPWFQLNKSLLLWVFFLDFPLLFWFSSQSIASFHCSTFNEVITLLIILTSYMFLVVTTLKMQLVGITKPSPPAPHTWPPSASSTAPSSSSAVCPTPKPPGTQSKWPLCFTRWSSPHWIPWSTVWEIRMSRTQWAN